ncbi:hypothetical protein VPNG_07682 [Cytospora leucostoma]|uniref:Uncharacterized protein n=1 Tax=Cytospora leucostoma TaxID=1230097 RepID=A0A423WFJ4_9PEZI|nr:hypothetical protein VPNG_07682 [Cytospora leucostoma]
MCFSEFIGYTCGHSSSEVLRPCPMTTQLYTNPLCARYARRPILAPEMCPACQRILHGRAVLIVEWEHRWMHERGVCGCEVQFPDLFRPRVVGRSQPVEVRHSNTESNDDTGNGRSNSEVETVLPRMGGNDKSGAKKVPALYQETTTTTTTMRGGDGRPEVAIRIPSFYGAEWVDEHRQLHLKGSCKCSGDFSFYQTPTSYRVAPSSSAERSREQATRMAHSRSLQSQSIYDGASTPYSSPQAQERKAQTTQKNSAHHPYHSQAPHADRGATGPPIPQRSPGAIYEVDPARSSNALYNFACVEGAKITSCADFQSVEFPRPKNVLPLVGLPIGAGPEGPAGLPHTGDFVSCVLHAREMIAALGDGPDRLLRRKSRSVSCLYELKVTVAGGRQGPARHSQSVGPSAGASDSENDLSDDQL